jgi:hypothetical protein
MRNRRSGGGKTPRPPTPRDQQIIRAVIRYGHMTRAQIQRLFFRKGGRLASIQAVCRRLKLLTERGYLSRIRLPTLRVPAGQCIRCSPG